MVNTSNCSSWNIKVHLFSTQKVSPTRDVSIASAKRCSWRIPQGIPLLLLWFMRIRVRNYPIWSKHSRFGIYLYTHSWWVTGCDEDQKASEPRKIRWLSNNCLLNINRPWAIEVLSSRRSSHKIAERVFIKFYGVSAVSCHLKSSLKIPEGNIWMLPQFPSSHQFAGLSPLIRLP